jgi:hypothetical protein
VIFVFEEGVIEIRTQNVNSFFDNVECKFIEYNT